MGAGLLALHQPAGQGTADVSLPTWPQATALSRIRPCGPCALALTLGFSFWLRSPSGAFSVRCPLGTLVLSEGPCRGGCCPPSAWKSSWPVGGTGGSCWLCEHLFCLGGNPVNIHISLLSTSGIPGVAAFGVSFLTPPPRPAPLSPSFRAQLPGRSVCALPLCPLTVCMP